MEVFPCSKIQSFLILRQAHKCIFHNKSSQFFVEIGNQTKDEEEKGTHEKIIGLNYYFFTYMDTLKGGSKFTLSFRFDLLLLLVLLTLFNKLNLIQLKNFKSCDMILNFIEWCTQFHSIS